MMSGNGPGQSQARHPSSMTGDGKILVRLGRKSLPQNAPVQRWLSRVGAFAMVGQSPPRLLFDLSDPGFTLHTLRARYDYGAALDTMISPYDVEEELADWVRTPSGVRHTLDWFLASGIWTGLLRRIPKLVVYKEAEELLASRMRFRQTNAYAFCRQALRDGRPVVRQHRQLDSNQRIDAYFERFEALFESIGRLGMQRPADSAWQDLLDPGRHISVAIAADGSLVKLPGAKHRVAIARLLGLPRIPVRVTMIHIDFLRARGVPQLTSSALKSLVAQVAHGPAGTIMHGAEYGEGHV